MPLASIAVTCTGVIPIPNSLPDTTDEVTVAPVGESSVTITSGQDTTCVLPSDGAFTSISVGQFWITGGTSSNSEIRDQESSSANMFGMPSLSCPLIPQKYVYRLKINSSPQLLNLRMPL